jgi:hypothetical protein
LRLGQAAPVPDRKINGWRMLSQPTTPTLITPASGKVADGSQSSYALEVSFREAIEKSIGNFPPPERRGLS